ncbi:alpha-ketoglutarate-dependent dioxygenase AlkB [Formosa sp. Hel1_33_131]|uniref:alpha-ketoglutarate-dependent dioxygenase AlkB family protein n=1 Tax=Formosa sp. Hel1_33_131 TaxID=1336794 RepID=UPI0008660161|nr:alpha-ketoglutarate-dependent dioxygenase AlkB [Formosa sp. Hel1_33_131]AOR27445.1 alpha-ketoglutarate-dependent dioxygenase AlkB [Formosa sp. Hel1_33_131]
MSMSLFDSSEIIKLPLQDAKIEYHPQFYGLEEASALFDALYQHTPWIEEDIRVYGKVYKQPRLTAFFANNQKTYGYSNISMTPHPFTPLLNAIKTKVEAATQTEFSSCLLNLYRDGQDSNGWHADDEKELGLNPVIASLSLGAERTFHLKHKKIKTLKHKLNLQNGSLLLMKNETQHHWLHQIPKTKKPLAKRINLTFRLLK